MNLNSKLLKQQLLASTIEATAFALFSGIIGAAGMVYSHDDTQLWVAILLILSSGASVINAITRFKLYLAAK